MNSVGSERLGRAPRLAQRALPEHQCVLITRHLLDLAGGAFVACDR